MAFTVREFPNQQFQTYKEFEDALFKRDAVERSLADRSGESEEVTRVTATVIPAPADLISQKVVELEEKVESLNELISALQIGNDEASAENKEGILIGTVLRGESRGKRFSLEALDEGYLCSDGQIYPSLSAAALGVSGNRRSGWKFWTDVEGSPIGATTGRFKSHAGNNPFASG